MLGIKAITSYLPNGRSKNIDLLSQFDMDENFLKEKIGVLERTIKSSDEDTSDLAFQALQRLMLEQELSPDSIQVLVVITQNPDHNIPHVSALVHGRACLPDSCAVFDISLGCSGYVYGLSILKSFMEANGMTKGILLTADPYSKIIDETDRNTVLLFGDAATATLIADDPILTLEHFRFGSKGKDWSAIRTDGGKFVMDGRAVFNFIATYIPREIRKLLEDMDLDMDQIDRYVLHQGSRFIVKTIADRLKQPMIKFPIDIEHCGNTVSSTIPLILQKELKDPSTTNIVLSGFGVGLSWASCLCKRVGEN